MAKVPISREITPRSLYLRRREFLQLGAVGLAGVGLGAGVLSRARPARAAGAKLAIAQRRELAGGEKLTSLEDVTHYNNFYEFGSDKEDPAKRAGQLRTRPWTVAFEGELGKPQLAGIDDLLKWFPLEERIYRLRCVETWSMVIPWVGFPLAELIKRLQPTSKAKYVAFTTLKDATQMPGQRTDILQWPYTEALRMDEAMHPLTLVAVGLYGEVLPNQNGAPLRLVVPWKYGFKSCKSIVKIRFLEQPPKTTWNIMSPGEYGFYANVNPDVEHPRWSQAKERRIGEFFKRKTLPFNGYASDVAHLYAGLDLKKNY